MLRKSRSPHTGNNFSAIFPHLWGNTPIISLGLMVILAGSGCWWLANIAIAPEIAQAYTASVDISLDRDNDESYQSFISRAESVARAAVQRSFDSNLLVSDVSIIIIGVNKGLEAQILEISVSRPQWKSRPDPKKWAKYFPTSQTLLKFDQPTSDSPPTTPTSPGTANPPATTTPPSPTPALPPPPNGANPNPTPGQPPAQPTPDQPK